MRKLQIILVVFLSVVLVAVSALAIFLSCQFQFPENAVVCKTDISKMISWMATEKIQKNLASYSLTLTVNGEQHTLTAEDLSLQLNEERLDRLIEEYKSGAAVVEDREFLTVDPAAVQTLLEQALAENRVEPGTSKLQWNAESNKFDLLKGEAGAYNDREKALQIVMDAVYRLDSAVTLKETDYRKPFTDEQKAAAENKALADANALVSCELTYIFFERSGAESPEVIDSKLIGSWLEIGQDGLTVTLDQDLIRTHANQLAKTYSMGGEGNFMSHNGEEINLPATVPENKVDAEALYKDILNSLNNLSSGRKEVPYSVRNAYKNFDGTYIEISIAEQKMRAYLNGELFADTDIITGCTHCDHDTLTGVFEIQDHYRDIWLQESYFVNYWMGFWSPKYGMHDADGWRTESEYGGDTYKTNGSGGCVNVPGKVISQMYKEFENGVPVIIFDETYILPLENAE